ncbi:hypothetical protein [Clostridium estertheticum]|uniref:hypothetical protein n=2 Tax=Clostridium estertheticum TaxID=238834 RepID=UPI001C0D7CC9|nr:hypothetical protein [Clostridium estertheticum]MBU3217492.1 hypothetical protein [Clostridium estertheticum]
MLTTNGGSNERSEFANEKMLRLNFTAEDLYPEDYDLNTLFVDYQQRKLERDIERGSKKALEKVQKEILKIEG